MKKYCTTFDKLTFKQMERKELPLQCIELFKTKEAAERINNYIDRLLEDKDKEIEKLHKELLEAQGQLAVEKAVNKSIDDGCERKTAKETSINSSDTVRHAFKDLPKLKVSDEVLNLMEDYDRAFWKGYDEPSSHQTFSDAKPEEIPFEVSLEKLAGGFVVEPKDGYYILIDTIGWSGEESYYLSGKYIRT